MAKMWFSVSVLIFAVQSVFAIMCPNRDQEISNCDQCLRCGGTWCSEPKNTGQHCWYHMNDDSCGRPENPLQIKERQQGNDSSSINPIYVEKSLLFKKEGKISFSYNSPVKRKVTHNIYNTTQTSNIYVKTNGAPKCDGFKCEIEIVATVNTDFCTDKGTEMEFIIVAIQVEDTPDEAHIKFHVPCACGCSKDKERRSQQCNGNGDYACGRCSCYQGWSGAHCEKMECEDGRGDVDNRCHNHLVPNVVCSGNGDCGPCDTCVCHSDKPGWQYFDQENFCSDVCMDTSGCESCLANSTLGHCDPSEAECTHSMKMLEYNETNAAQMGELGREWIKCNSTFKDSDCYVEYFAMRTEGGISVMVVEPCSKSVAVPVVVTSPAGSKVPIILGVLALVAVVAAVGGVMLWKHLNAAAAMPFSSPDYENIDAEDCVGENPLYKPPTSTFTNPQFGKC